MTQHKRYSVDQDYECRVSQYKHLVICISPHILLDFRYKWSNLSNVGIYCNINRYKNRDK